MTENTLYNFSHKNALFKFENFVLKSDDEEEEDYDESDDRYHERKN